MARIRGKDTGPELMLRRALRARGVRYRPNLQGVAGKPDIAFPREKVAAFVHGCFWHGCPIHYRQPKTRAGFWRNKIAQNQRRDVKRRRELRAEGWAVLEFWEHEVEADPDRCARRVMTALRRATREKNG